MPTSTRQNRPILRRFMANSQPLQRDDVGIVPHKQSGRFQQRTGIESFESLNARPRKKWDCAEEYRSIEVFIRKAEDRVVDGILLALQVGGDGIAGVRLQRRQKIAGQVVLREGLRFAAA